MKTNEFIRRVESLSSDDMDVTVSKETDRWVIKVYDIPVAGVSFEKRFDLYTFTGYFFALPPFTQSELLYLVTEYSSTPLEEREKEKKYYIKFPGTKEEMAYLNYHPKIGYHLGDKFENIAYKIRFTQSEIDEFPGDVKKLISVAECIENEL